ERDGQPPPGIDQLLVVTYTKAATAELRERLRRRLSELAQTLAGDGDPGGDPFLPALAARFPPGPVRTLALQRLNAAITGFDAAAIYTIHGFCQRVLTDAAFESSQTFEAELVSDDEDRLVEIVDDFWRRRVVDDPLLAQVLVDNGETP
ncbi:exodeoxyribonuclease V subunit beta, partial [Pseudomonas sp. MWU13-2860]